MSMRVFVLLAAEDKVETNIGIIRLYVISRDSRTKPSS